MNTEDDDDLPTVVPNLAADFIVPTDYVIPAGVDLIEEDQRGDADAGAELDDDEPTSDLIGEDDDDDSVVPIPQGESYEMEAKDILNRLVRGGYQEAAAVLSEKAAQAAAEEASESIKGELQLVVDKKVFVLIKH